MNTNPSHGRRELRWFVLWVIVGACYCFGLLAIFSIGVPLLLVAITATIVMARRQPDANGVVGLITGLGLPLFYVALLNRSGPGTVCTTTTTSQSCVDESSPWPWLLFGAALFASGITGALLLRRRHGHQLGTGVPRTDPTRR